eukprot:g3523.t1
MAKQLCAKMVVALTLAAGGGNTVEGVQLAVNPAAGDDDDLPTLQDLPSFYKRSLFGEWRKKFAKERKKNVNDGNACNAFDDDTCREMGNKMNKGNLKKKAGAKQSLGSIPGVADVSPDQGMYAMTERCCENDASASAKDGSTSCA